MLGQSLKDVLMISEVSHFRASPSHLRTFLSSQIAFRNFALATSHSRILGDGASGASGPNGTP